MENLKKNKQDDFVDFVFKEMIDTFKKNKEASDQKYSLRLYAKHLEMDPTFLSRLMKKEKRFTYKSALRVAKKLDLPINEIQKKLGTINDISDQVFNPISHWYFFAIIELRHNPAFKLEPNWIMSQLPISFEQAQGAINILTNQEHVKVEQGEYQFNLESGRWVNIETNTDDRINYQKEINELANKALEKVPHKKRHTYGLTVAASPDVLPKIRLKIRNLAEEIADMCSKSKKSKVYQFQSHFFPINPELGA